MIALRRLFAIVFKELMQLKRDRLTFAMIIGIPTIQLLLFGFAINMDVRNLDAAIVDQADTFASRAFVQEIAQSQVIRVRASLREPASIDALLRAGDVSVAIVIPRDFDKRLARGDRSFVQMVADGSDPVIGQAARQIARAPRTMSMTATAPSKPAASPAGTTAPIAISTTPTRAPASRASIPEVQVL